MLDPGRTAGPPSSPDAETAIPLPGATLRNQAQGSAILFQKRGLLCLICVSAQRVPKPHAMSRTDIAYAASDEPPNRRAPVRAR
eukprot:2425511-Rhodomonas_salina.2